MGGISAYWLAQRRFVSERAWEKRYELYGEIFDILNQLEHSLVTFEQAVAGNHEFRGGAEVQSAATAYKAGLLRLNQLQERLLLLGADEAHMKMMVVYAGLRVFDPAMVMEPPELKESEIQELRDLIKHSRREASGRNGEIAFLARRELGLETSRVVRWWRRRRRSARLRSWVSSYGRHENGRQWVSDAGREKDSSSNTAA